MLTPVKRGLVAMEDWLPSVTFGGKNVSTIYCCRCSCQAPRTYSSMTNNIEVGLAALEQVERQQLLGSGIRSQIRQTKRKKEQL